MWRSKEKRSESVQVIADAAPGTFQIVTETTGKTVLEMAENLIFEPICVGSHV